jgi:Type I restriction modification DNA specificity domain
MADPFLECPASWLRATLEPDPGVGLIEDVGTGGTPRTGDSACWDGDVLWLTPKEVVRRTEGLCVTQTERTLTERGLRTCGARVLAPGTVMLTKRAPVGAVAVAAAPMATNQGFLNFTCGARLRPLYLAYWLLANRPYLELVANGSTYPELYKSDLFEFEIAVPDLATQDRVVEFFASLEFLILLGLPLGQTTADPARQRTLQEETRRLRRLRDALLPWVLGGRIRVSDGRLVWR